MKSLNVKLFKNVDESINYMKSIKFAETKVVVSGRLYSELVEKFKKNIKVMCIAPKIIVFTSNIINFLKNNSDYQNDKNRFYSSGGVMIGFDDVKELLKSNYSNIIEEEIEKEIHYSPDEVQLIFEYIDQKEKLLLPMFFKALIDNTSNDSKQSYTKILYNNYHQEQDDLKIMLGSITSIPDIPIEILSKYYARLYTSPSRFHSDINKNLGLNRIEKYMQFIKTLYEGVKFKSLPLSNNKELYRGSKISNVEIDKIKGYMEKK